MSIQAFGSMMEQVGEARQRAFDKADTNGDGTLSLGEFTTALQAQQGGTNGSANPAATPVSNTQASALFSKLDVSGTGQLTMQELNQGTAARPHGGHHGHHGGGAAGGAASGGMSGLLGGDTMGALLGGQESTGDATAEAGQSGLFASVESAVKKAIGSYFSSAQQAATVAPTTTTSTAATAAAA